MVRARLTAKQHTTGRLDHYQYGVTYKGLKQGGVTKVSRPCNSHNGIPYDSEGFREAGRLGRQEALLAIWFPFQTSRRGQCSFYSNADSI